jgi:hypothetical protein
MQPLLGFSSMVLISFVVMAQLASSGSGQSGDSLRNCSHTAPHSAAAIIETGGFWRIRKTIRPASTARAMDESQTQ